MKGHPRADAARTIEPPSHAVSAIGAVLYSRELD